MRIKNENWKLKNEQLTRQNSVQTFGKIPSKPSGLAASLKWSPNLWVWWHCQNCSNVAHKKNNSFVRVIWTDLGAIKRVECFQLNTINRTQSVYPRHPKFYTRIVYNKGFFLLQGLHIRRTLASKRGVVLNLTQSYPIRLSTSSVVLSVSCTKQTSKRQLLGLFGLIWGP